jgi:hypothetical protein
MKIWNQANDNAPRFRWSEGEQIEDQDLLVSNFIWRFRERPMSRIGKSGPAQEKIKNFFKIAGSPTAKASVLYRT